MSCAQQLFLLCSLILSHSLLGPPMMGLCILLCWSDLENFGCQVNTSNSLLSIDMAFPNSGDHVTLQLSFVQRY